MKNDNIIFLNEKELKHIFRKQSQLKVKIYNDIKIYVFKGKRNPDMSTWGSKRQRGNCGSTIHLAAFGATKPHVNVMIAFPVV